MTSASLDKEKKESKPEKGKDTPSFDMKELQDLADLIEERGFTDFEFENEKIRVRMSKAATQSLAPLAPSTTPPVAPQLETENSSAIKEGEEADSDDGLHKITSPIVGTFYRAPGPDKDPYVKEGDTVSSDSIVCIVEAMKLMNEIQAETSGEIVKIYIEDGQPVEYGQELFGIKK